MNIEIRKLSAGDIDLFIEVIRLFEDVFEMKDFKMPPTHHLQKLLNKDSFFVFAAIEEGHVVGVMTAYSWDQYYATAPLMYIFDLAVATSHQRKGIGRKLIEAINTYAKENGYQEVFVQADKVDEHALEFYRNTGGMAEEVVHFTYSDQKNNC